MCHEGSRYDLFPRSKRTNGSKHEILSRIVFRQKDSAPNTYDNKNSES